MTAAIFTPTADADGNPTVCRCCGRHAIGIGVGFTSRQDTDPGFLCRECVLLVEQIMSVRRMDQYELKALDGGVDAVGSYLTQIGKTDLAECDELEARMLVKAVWQGCGDRLRQLLRDGVAPF